VSRVRLRWLVRTQLRRDREMERRLACRAEARRAGAKTGASERRLVSRAGIEPATRRLRVVPATPNEAISEGFGGAGVQNAASGRRSLQPPRNRVPFAPPVVRHWRRLRHQASSRAQSASRTTRAASPGAKSARRVLRISPAEPQAVSERMTKYWAELRKAKPARIKR